MGKSNPCFEKKLEDILISALLCKRIAEHIVNEVIPANPEGFTFDIISMCEVERLPTGFYLVGLKGYEKFFVNSPSIKEVALWMAETIHLICHYGYYVGGWRGPQNLFYLDLINLVHEARRAQLSGVINQQQQIYNLATGECISNILYNNDNYKDSVKKIIEILI